MRKDNKILLGFLSFTLTLFIYKDFGIPTILGYGCLGFFLIVSFMRHNLFLRLNDINNAFFALALFEILAIIDSLVSFGKSNFILYIPALILCVVCLVGASPTKNEIVIASRVLTAVATLFSCYVIAVRFRPIIYYGYIARLLTAESRDMATFMLENGYGICVGGNAVFIDYIVIFALIMHVNNILINKDKRKVLVSACMALLFFTAVILENRKSELLGALVVIALLIITKFNFKSTGEHLKKAAPIFGAILVIAPILIYMLYVTESLTRYLSFIEKISQNITSNTAQDISTGRLSMWKIAMDLFRENPVTGIGWGAFAQYVPSSMQSGHQDLFEVRNVHNCYLQILCETGIIGFVILVGLLFFIFASSIKKSLIMKKKNADSLDCIIMSTCVGYQLFFLVVGFIDPTWYKLLFLCLFTIDLILINATFRRYRS